MLFTHNNTLILYIYNYNLLRDFLNNLGISPFHFLYIYKQLKLSHNF